MKGGDGEEISALGVFSPQSERERWTEGRRRRRDEGREHRERERERAKGHGKLQAGTERTMKGVRLERETKRETQ